MDSHHLIPNMLLGFVFILSLAWWFLHKEPEAGIASNMGDLTYVDKIVKANVGGN